MNRINVLGIGSPYGDDQAGWKVVDLLKQNIVIPPNISPYVLIECHDRPGIRLIELMSKTDTVFLIDAIKTNKPLGTIHRFKKEDILEPKNQFSSHHIGVLQALQIAEALNLLPNKILFYGIEIDTIILEPHLSPAVILAVAQLAAQLKIEIEALFVN